MQALVEAASHAYEVALVASDNPDAPGLTWARDRGIPTLAARGKRIEREAAIDAALREARVEVIALAGYMRLLSDDFVARWRGRIVNIHPSLLPLYKGLDTHARAIAAGDTEAGCSVHGVGRGRGARPGARADPVRRHGREPGGTRAGRRAFPLPTRIGGVRDPMSPD